MSGITERQVHLLDYWQVLLKRRWIVYSSLLLVTGLVTLGSFLVRPLYTTTVQLQIEKYRPNVLPFQDVMTSYTDFRDDFYETQSRLIQSRTVARAVVRKLELAQHSLFEISPTKREELHLTPDDVELRLADKVRAATKVDLIRNSRLANVSFVSADPQMSAQIANAIADAYIQFNAQAAYSSSEQATESMSRQVETLRGEISEKERQLQEYARQQEIIPLDDRQNVTTQKLNDLNIAYTKAQTARIEKEARYAAFKEFPVESIPELMNNELLQTLAANHAELERDYASMSKRFKPEWPALARLKSEMDKVKSRLEAERTDLHKRMLGDAREQYQAALKEEQALGEALGLQKTEAQEAGLRTIEYNNLKIEIDNRRKTLEAMMKRQSETGATAGMAETRITNVRVVDRAEVPRFPSSPRKLFNFLLSLLGGLGLGVGLAFFFDYMDDSINTAEDLTKAAGIPCLGLIPAHDQSGRRLRVVRGKAANGDESRPEIDLAALRDARSHVSEAFREVRTGVLVSSPGRPPKNLLVTSSQPREGKTATALNLAITLAQLSRKVLLVDADLRRPRLHKALGVGNEAGLSNVLSGGDDVAALTIPAGCPGLFLLPSGPTPPNPAELLDSAEFTALAQRLCADGSYDHVIYDSPPILHVADAAIMAARMDAVILVVQASQTPRDNVARAAEKLRLVKARLLGALLNQVDLTGRGYRASYYTYYGQEAEGAGAPEAEGASGDIEAEGRARGRGKRT